MIISTELSVQYGSDNAAQIHALTLTLHALFL